MAATDWLRTAIASQLIGAPLTVKGLPDRPLYCALGNGSPPTGTVPTNTDIALYAEVYGTRLALSYTSVYQAYTSQFSRNYTVSNPTGTFTECGLFDQDVSNTTLASAVSAGATTLPVASATSPAVYGSTQAGHYTTAYLNDTAHPEYVSLSAAASAGAASWTLQSGLQYAHASGTAVVVFTGNLLTHDTLGNSGVVNQAGKSLTIQTSVPVQNG